MTKVFRSIRAAVLLACLVFPVFAGEFQDFITCLNTNWVARSYSGIVQTINARLAVKTNDLPALVAKADYYTSIDLNMTTVSNLVPQIEILRTNLNWSADEEAGIILDEMIDSMKNKEKNESAGYVYGVSSNQLNALHQEFPTNHPGVTFFERFAVIQYGTAE